MGDNKNIAAAPWWELLPHDFYRQADGTTIDHLNPVKIATTAGLDRVVRSGLGAMISAGMAPSVLMRSGMKADLARGDFYREMADRGNVDEVLVRPRKVPVETARPRRGGFKPKGIPVRELSFNSPFEALHPEMRKPYASLKNNRKSHALYWSEPSRPRPTLIFLHGYSLSNYAVNSRMFSLPWFYKRGYDILLVTMPFHGQRRERLDPFNGYGWFAHGTSHVNESMLQAVSDTRNWVDFLESRGAPAIGISGLSMGGYISTLMASVDDRLAFSIPNSPVVAPVDMALEWWPIGHHSKAMSTGATTGEFGMEKARRSSTDAMSVEM
ncbi:MAG: alpha/beta hydrolase family protein [Salinisphaeraceae bacterium]|nr:alpha/beta hydrolase family protein [Salinisphaeraceae bacterium]